MHFMLDNILCARVTIMKKKNRKRFLASWSLECGRGEIINKINK